MKLPFLAKKKEEKEFFLTLILSSGKISSILFEKTGNKLLILGASSKDYEGSLDSLPPQKLLELSDVVITGVEEKLPGEESFSKTIFAIPHNWVFEGKIVKEKLASLKTLCDELRLTPVGFVVSIEAVIAYLHRKEGAPVTAIFAEAGENHVTVSIVKSGIILGVFESPLEHDAAKTIDSLLLSQNVTEVLPPKIILLNFEHGKKIQQSVLSHSWSKTLSFLHIPQVIVLDQEIESQAVIAGVSSQMGFSDIPDVHMKTIEKTHVPVEIASEVEIAGEAANEIQKDEELKPTEAVVGVESDVQVSSEEFGFFKDVDVLSEKVAEKETTSDNLDNFEEEHDAVSVPLVRKVATKETHTLSKPKFALPVLAMPKLKLPKFKNMSIKGKAPLLYPLVAVVIIIAAVIGYYFLYEKAEVVVILDQREVTKEEDVVFALDSPTSVEESTIKISEKEVTVEGSEEMATTGKKETGEKSKGEVTIYNKTENKKVFPKGSVIVGPNNLLFTLLDEVSVASTSSFSTTFSNAKGKVEASKFGKEYNIPSGTNFSFEGQSTANFFAKNDSSFSGGSKKEIKVVSESDMNDLATKLVTTLTKKALEQESAVGGSDGQLLPNALSYSFDEKNFSKEEGQEASAVSLTAALALKLGYIEKDEISNFAKGAGSSEIPASYIYSDKDSKVSIEDIEENEDGDITGKIVMSSVFLPQVSTSEFLKKLTGKSEGKVSEIVSGEGISNSEVIFLRSLPFMPKLLPFNKNNIAISVRAD